MSYHDEVLTFSCQDESLIGVLSAPAAPAAMPAMAAMAVLIVVGGPQYRIGSHRQFVLLARCLADAGFPTLRFDHRGIGDSSGEAPGFEAIGRDIQAAIDALYQRLPQLAGVVIWGLCDAASAALLYHNGQRDPRVKGLALVNPWVRSPESLARAHVKHYYLDRLKQGSFWRKLLRGELGTGAWRGLLSNLHAALLRSANPKANSFQRQMAQAWQQFPGALLLILSEQDYTAKEFLEATASQPVWLGALKRERLTRVDIDQADHTFSARVAREQLEQATLDWLRGLT